MCIDMFKSVFVSIKTKIWLDLQPNLAVEDQYMRSLYYYINKFMAGII